MNQHIPRNRRQTGPLDMWIRTQKVTAQKSRREPQWREDTNFQWDSGEAPSSEWASIVGESENRGGRQWGRRGSGGEGSSDGPWKCFNKTAALGCCTYTCVQHTPGPTSICRIKGNPVFSPPRQKQHRHLKELSKLPEVQVARVSSGASVPRLLTLMQILQMISPTCIQRAFNWGKRHPGTETDLYSSQRTWNNPPNKHLV